MELGAIGLRLAPFWGGGVEGERGALTGPTGESPGLDGRVGGGCGWKFSEAFYRRLDCVSVGEGRLHASSRWISDEKRQSMVLNSLLSWQKMDA